MGRSLYWSDLASAGEQLPGAASTRIVQLHEMTLNRTEQPLAVLVDRLRQEFPELLAVYRFGSFGTEYEWPDSGLDIAVYAGTPLPAVKLWRIARGLAAGAGHGHYG